MKRFETIAMGRDQISKTPLWKLLVLESCPLVFFTLFVMSAYPKVNNGVLFIAISTCIYIAGYALTVMSLFYYLFLWGYPLITGATFLLYCIVLTRQWNTKGSEWEFATISIIVFGLAHFAAIQLAPGHSDDQHDEFYETYFIIIRCAVVTWQLLAFVAMEFLLRVRKQQEKTAAHAQ